MWAVVVATLCAGLFAGAAIYVNAVEHPARLSCGVDVALREFGPSYRRATVMQASLAITGCATGLLSAWLYSDFWLALGAILLGSVVPFTLVAILPTNHQLVDPALDPRGQKAIQLLERWGRLHAVRSVLSSTSFLLLLLRLARLCRQLNGYLRSSLASWSADMPQFAVRLRHLVSAQGVLSPCSQAHIRLSTAPTPRQIASFSATFSSSRTSTSAMDG